MRMRRPNRPRHPRPDARTVAAAIAEDGLRAGLEALAAATEGSDHYRAVGSTGYDRAVALSSRSSGQPAEP